jgi:hypothetical protein
MAEPSTHINYSFEDIQRYLQNKMSAAEMHALEKAALQDPFLSDAIEGYRETSSTTAQQHLNEINASLQEEKQDSKIIPLKKNNQWLRIAAIIILLAGVGVTGTYFFKKSDKQNQIAQVKKEEPNKNIIAKDSVETVKPEALSANKNSAPVIAQNKKKQNIQSVKKTKARELYINADTINENETNSVASLSVPSQHNAEADKAFAPAPYSIQKNYDSTQYLLQDRVSGLNISENTFTGKVVDENNKPIPGVVVTTNYKSGVVTDLNGNFTLQNNDSLIRIRTTAVGYMNKNVLLKPSEANLITLEQSQSALNDVVVTGYGISKNKSKNQTAMPVGGWQNFNNYVMSKLDKDSTRDENNISYDDIVELEFLIDDSGNPYHIRVKRPLDEQRNSKAIDILKSGPKWTNASKKKKAKVAIAF